MNYIDVNTTELERGEYYLFEFGNTENIEVGETNAVDITEGTFNEAPQYTSRCLGKYLVKYFENQKTFPTFIFYDILKVNNKIPVFEEYDEGYLEKDRILIYNYGDNSSEIPIRVYKPSETTIYNIKQKHERKMSKTLKQQRKVNKIIKRMTKKVKPDELRTHIRSFISSQTP